MYRQMPLLDSGDAARFWERVNVALPDACWYWLMGKDKNGYGKWTVHQITLRAHRVAYYLHYGVDPDQLLVCHSCDHPTCCNPAHLFLGDNQTNILDSLHKGRQRRRSGDQHGLRLHPEAVLRGEDQPSAKLTEDQAIEVRRLYRDERWTQRQIASHYGVTREAISQIVRGNNWKHLIADGEQASLSDASRKIMRGEHQGNAKLTENDVREIRQLYAAGFRSCTALGRRFGVSHGAIRAILQGRTWGHVS